VDVDSYNIELKDEEQFRSRRTMRVTWINPAAHQSVSGDGGKHAVRRIQLPP
jgi:hypothetical protein